MVVTMEGRFPPRWACSAVGSAPEWHSGGHRFDPGQVHQPFISIVDRPQVAEGRCGYAGSNKAFSVERDSVCKEQLLEPLALFERCLHPEVGDARPGRGHDRRRGQISWSLTPRSPRWRGNDRGDGERSAAHADRGLETRSLQHTSTWSGPTEKLRAGWLESDRRGCLQGQGNTPREALFPFLFPHAQRMRTSLNHRCADNTTLIGATSASMTNGPTVPATCLRWPSSQKEA
jgi:hypothetical protein